MVSNSLCICLTCRKVTTAQWLLSSFDAYVFSPCRHWSVTTSVHISTSGLIWYLATNSSVRPPSRPSMCFTIFSTKAMSTSTQSMTHSRERPPSASSTTLDKFRSRSASFFIRLYYFTIFCYCFIPLYICRYPLYFPSKLFAPSEGLQLCINTHTHFCPAVSSLCQSC